MSIIDEKIKKTIEENSQIHQIFKDIFNKKSLFIENEEIVDLVYIEKEYLDDKNDESEVISPAKILVATTNSLIFAEEGYKKISSDCYGYKIKNIYYDKISSFELDTCLLKGKFKIATGSSNIPECVIEFKTVKYFNEFEIFIESIKNSNINFIKN